MELGQERQVNVGHKERVQASAEVALSCKCVIANEDALSVLFVCALLGRTSQSAVRNQQKRQKVMSSAKEQVICFLVKTPTFTQVLVFHINRFSFLQKNIMKLFCYNLPSITFGHHLPQLPPPKKIPPLYWSRPLPFPPNLRFYVISIFFAKRHSC